MSRSEWFDEEPREGRSAGQGSGDGPADGGPERPVRARQPRRRRPFGPTLAVLAALIFLGSLAARWLTDYWWFGSVGFERVFLTMWGTRIGLFVVGFLITAGAVAASLLTAYRTRPFIIPTTPAQQTLDQYRQALHPLRKVAIFAIPTILGLLAGSGAMGGWRTLLLWRNAEPFGQKDPQFGLDIGFFVFTLPWLRFVVSFLTVVLILSLVAALFTHYVYGGLQLPGRGPSTRAAFAQIGIVGALLALVRGGAYWLDRYSLSTADSKLITGITYAGENAVLPSKAILALASVMCAIFFLVSIWMRSWRLPIIGVALLTITAVLIGGIYPALVQTLKVNPSEKALETPYIQRNIAATRTAYGLNNIKQENYSATTDVQAGQLREDAATIPGIRLVDPNVVGLTFRQLEGLRQYYTFPDTLDVDRYQVDGKLQDAVVAVRELNLDGVPQAQRNWVNDHTVYTHGFGLVSAYGNQRTSEGDPVFMSSGLTDPGKLPKYEPRIYFGEQSPAYSIVGEPAGSEPREFDFPDDSGTGGQRNNTYTGKGGVPVGSLLRKTAYAVTYREPKILLSNQVNSASKILDYRSPKERIERVAPWLTLDGNAYPAVIDGRIQWIVDGYTTTSKYPNSRLVDLADATSDSVSESSRVVTVGAGQINYIRNSVKATVDAYDGTVKLYGWDETDPLLKAWSKVFPGTVRPVSEISADLMSHLRYPQDMFKVQRQMLTRYHVTDAGSFYTGQDFWRIPKDPTHNTQDQPAYYQSLAMPGQDAPSFSLATTFIPTGQGREILRGFLAVDADAGSSAGKPAGTYGQMRLLELPRTSSIDGPGQVENQIQSSTERSQSETEQFNLGQFIAQNNSAGKQLTFGNLLTLPVGGGLLYVQPIYVQAAKEGGSFPQIKATVAMFGKKIAWGETLDQALDGLFGGNSGATAGDENAGAGGAGTPTGQGNSGSASGQQAADLAKAIADLQAANTDGQEALKKGDFAAYGEAQKRLADAINRVSKVAPGLVSPSASASPSASPSATPSPSGTP